MKPDTFYEFAIGIFIVFIAFNYLYPGAAFVGLLFGLVALVGAFFFIRGCAEFVLGKGTEHLWIGAALCVMLMVLFGGGQAVANAFNLIFGAIGGVLALLVV